MEKIDRLLLNDGRYSFFNRQLSMAAWTENDSAISLH
jgi:hypothetical protein